MKVIKIVIWSIIGLGVALIATGLIVSKGDLRSMFDSSANKVALEYTTDATINELEININCDNLIVKEATDGILKVTYYDDPEDSKYSFSVAGSKLSINQKKMLFSFNLKNLDLVLYLPTNIFTGIDVNISSGKIEIKDFALTIDELDLNITSGNIDINNLTVDEAEIDTTSGMINVANTTFKSLDVDATSGSINLENISTNTLDGNATSGSVKIQNSALGNVDFETTSASVKWSNITCKNIDITSTSGKVELDINELGTNYEITCHVTSGDVEINGTGINYSGNDNFTLGTATIGKIKVTSTSGFIDMQFD